MASERDEAKRATCRTQIVPLDQRRFLVVDETSTHTAMSRRYAWAPRGQRAYGWVPRNHGRTLSAIGVLGVEGMVATMSVDGAVDTEVFDIFVKRVLVPTLRPGDIVLLDNLSVHPASGIEQAVTEAQGHVLFLPPHAPDFSPLEHCWAKVKTCLRSFAARPRGRLEAALSKALTFIQPEDIHGWFTHCGYLVSSE